MEVLPFFTEYLGPRILGGIQFESTRYAMGTLVTFFVLWVFLPVGDRMVHGLAVAFETITVFFGAARYGEKPVDLGQPDGTVTVHVRQAVGGFLELVQEFARIFKFAAVVLDDEHSVLQGGLHFWDGGHL